eukprot:CAMPEP_0172001486 /NCGR_PEP_ID=MMETSP1041-20130122/2899_1 /TAXON_ID=464988 /ORGANISM="Hemiselmis andersenii, Strain CCMP439" /LENGTH=254 /DNA_ID=CAMNT_0012655137 /DNA_START=63 /DNA_END=827 /DNA_ORIENTATION=-
MRSIATILLLLVVSFALSHANPNIHKRLGPKRTKPLSPPQAGRSSSSPSSSSSSSIFGFFFGSSAPAADPTGGGRGAGRSLFGLANPPPEPTSGIFSLFTGDAGSREGKGAGVLAGSLGEYFGVVRVTLAYFVMYYVFILTQAFNRIKVIRQKKKAEKEGRKVVPVSQDKGQMRWDRTVGNTLEQQNPFLWGLWLNALFVGPGTAEMLGWAYVICRLFYPFVFPLSRPLLYTSTFPNYWVIIALWGQLWYKAAY